MIDLFKMEAWGLQFHEEINVKKKTKNRKSVELMGWFSNSR